MERNLYLECYAGISGDMTVGALLDLGAEEEVLRRELDKLPVHAYELRVNRKKEQGIDACDFHVLLGEAHEDEDIEPGTHHGHSHRTMNEIEKMITQSQLEPEIKDTALKIFWILAEAEGKVHGKPAEEVGFHEVGAVDSIVDIVGTAICLHNLKISHIYLSDLYEGQGTVECQHGRIPVPVPAVLEITKRYQLPLHITDNIGEMVTPTGAAIAAALGEPCKDVFEGQVLKEVGIGCGKRNYSHANILRAMLFEKRGM